MTVREFFEAFLEKEGALDSFKKYIDDDKLNRLCEGNEITDIVLSAFSWIETEEGLDYWSGISVRWKAHISDFVRTKLNTNKPSNLNKKKGGSNESN